MNVTEQRFREGSGEKYLADGMTIRCQGLSKGRIANWRAEHGDDFTIPNEDLWPECQCMRAAVPGMFACKFHGGVTKSKNPPKSIMEVLPVDLQRMFEMIYKDPMYISRQEEIMLLKARNLQVLEELSESAGNEEAWGLVVDAIKDLSVGESERALHTLKEALKHKDKTKETWQEIRANNTVLKDLTNTQTRTAQVLQSMATAEQVTALVNNIINTIIEGAGKYINDTDQRIGFLKYISGRIAGFTNFRAGTVIEQVTAGSGENGRNAE